MTWKGWLFIVVNTILIGILSGLAQMMREEAFGSDIVWLAGFILPLYLAVFLVLLIVFRRPILEWAQSTSDDD